MEGRVLRTTGLQCLVLAQGKTWVCPLRGRLKQGKRRTNTPVVAGDLVEIDQTEEGTGIIEQVYPRKSKISRVASGSRPVEQVVAANVDRFVVIAAVKKPRIRAGFIDRALIIAAKNAIEPVICLNKVDLGLSTEATDLTALYRDLGYRVLFTSAQTGEGIASLKALLANRMAALIGQSGVGKSSLINCLDPQLELPTQDMMQRHDRGRHTTTAVELYPLSDGGFVIDTPGVKELSPWGMGLEDLERFFSEMQPFAHQCRFRDCSHIHEPGCGVLAAVANGQLAARRWQSYQRMRGELEHNEGHERTVD